MLFQAYYEISLLYFPTTYYASYVIVGYYDYMGRSGVDVVPVYI